MNKVYSTFLLLFFGLTMSGQDNQVTLENSRYLIFDLSEDQNVSDLQSSIDLREQQSEDIITPALFNSEFIRLPFYGLSKLNQAKAITHLNVDDPLKKYGLTEVLLQSPIQLSKPFSESISTGYQLTMSSSELKSILLNQLPIRPDSLRVTIQSKFVDQALGQISIISNNRTIDVESFSRNITIERRVEVKIEPFGWESVNNISPMIDWDQSYNYDQVIYWNDKYMLPVALKESRNNYTKFALLDQQENRDNHAAISGILTIKAVPNPAINDLRFEINNAAPGTYTIRVKNILGEQKIVKTIKISASEIIPIDIDALRKGSYFYILEDDDGNVISTKRLIVLRP